jgi:hypothetical protein
MVIFGDFLAKEMHLMRRGSTVHCHMPYKINNKERSLTDTQKPLQVTEAVTADW